MLALARVVRARAFSILKRRSSHVLLSFHLPLADFRSFTPNSGKLNAPAWPFPFSGFIRGFGGVRLRKRGGVPDFIGEDALCEARGAIKLESGQIAYGSKRSKFLCKHRRLFHDGLCFTRLDIGFVSGKSSTLSAVQTECAMHNLLALQVRPLRTKEDLSSDKSRLPLVSIGKYVSTAYLSSTTSARTTSPIDPRCVMPGRPLVLLEYHKSQGQYAAPPTGAKRIDLPSKINIGVHFLLLNTSGTEVPAWILAALPHSHQRVVRDLRLYITRLHSERECLARVLYGLALGVIAPKRGTAESNNLQRYLRDSIKRLDKISKLTGEYFSESGPVDFAAMALENAQRGRSRALHEQALEQLSRLDVRPSIIQAAERAQSFVYIENHNESYTYTMSGDHLSNSSKTVISGSSIGSISNSFNNAVGRVESDDLKSSLNELKTSVEALCNAASPEKAREIAKHFDKFVSEATDSAPNKDYLGISAKGLIDAANALSLLVVPISDLVNRIIALVCP